jgi:hemerythrin
MAVSNAFEWHDEYRIGVAHIDDQHEQLFAIANRLHDDLDVFQLQEELMRLYSYTREHFSAEEALMREAEYPEYARHQRAHEALIEALNVRAKQVVRDPEQLPLLRKFLAKWISDHIKFDDQLLADYLSYRKI